MEKMERELEKDLLKILKKEKFQGNMISYMSNVGKLLLFVLPVLLVVLTLFTLFIHLSFTLNVIFYAVLAIYLFNSIMLFLGANSTESSLKMRLHFERILFLYYLKFQEVLTEEQFIQELKEVINVDSDTFDIEKGMLIESIWYFSQKDIGKLFSYIKKFNPGFFNIIDRLQLELADNIERLSRDPIYMDSTAQEVVFLNSELNIFCFLYNNSPEAKKYIIKINAPDLNHQN